MNNSSSERKKKRTNPQIGAVLIKQKKEKEKTNDWPPKQGPVLVK